VQRGKALAVPQTDFAGIFEAEADCVDDQVLRSAVARVLPAEEGRDERQAARAHSRVTRVEPDARHPRLPDRPDVPEIYEMQIRVDRTRRRARVQERTGDDPW